ncbi:uncharacterized protein LOC123547109 isoform X2 [Mercenaria mercenaria]|uniref:uncharacterized protein LOC123547109 isoform X2 n=1 Tax=Mercenaria mercenaria TaxID=6596 RepID=UPI00234F54C4|nr:uncharacterized protein LOC123547109 isoform X2 [Mercenaria mercenaria]
MARSKFHIALLFSIILTFIGNARSTGSSKGTFGRNFFFGILKPYRIDTTEKVTLMLTSANKTGHVNILVPYLRINATMSFTGHFKYSISNSIIQSSSNTVENRGIYVTSDIDVSLVVITSPNGNYYDASESFMIMPTSMLSSSYIISSYTIGVAGSWDSNFLILATENDTALTVTNNKVVGQSPLSLSMNAMDTYLYDSRDDLSDTLVRSNKPIAVFSGHEATGAPHGCNRNHYQSEQLLPTSMFGREFIVPPMLSRSGYTVRVYGAEPNTIIYYTLSSRNEKRQLGFPGHYEINVSGDKPLHIYSNNPVQVMLYSICSPDGTSMTIVPATQQYQSTYFFTVSSAFSDVDNYIAIMASKINNMDGLRIGGQRMRGLVQSYNMSLSVGSYIVNIYKVYAGVYKLEHVNGLRFGALQFGFGGSNHKAYSNVLGLGIPAAAEINECLSSPCQNGGSCIDGVGNYTCQCPQTNPSIKTGQEIQTFLTGYSGINCENDINECDIQPSVCLNGGVCVNLNGTYSCKCGNDRDGNYFSGFNCEMATTYCVVHQDVVNDQPACKNNGTCRALVGDYRCDCAPGFSGRRCRTNIDECATYPCRYNSTCVDGINGHTCVCMRGRTGVNCDIDIDDCASTPCLNGGLCIDHINRYNCNCTETGFTGVTCDINIDDCEAQPCLNGGTCYDLVKDFKCICYPGYNGKWCEIDINECASNPCQYSSTCLEKSNRTLYDINSRVFENLAFSYANASGYLCECVPGTAGGNCEINIDDCRHDNCHNGTCFDLLNSYRCDCDPGFQGDYCDMKSQTSDGPTCLQCKDVYHTNMCNRVTKCAPGQVCFVEKFTTHYGQVLYNTGCSDTKLQYMENC